MKQLQEESMQFKDEGKQPAVNFAVAAIVAEGFFSRLSFGLISFALPLYAYHLGMSLTQIGLLISLESAISLILKPITGWLVDRIGLKHGLTIAICMRTGVALCLALAGGPLQLFAIRILHGAANALRDPSSSALIAVHGGKKAIGSSFAWYVTAKSVAASFGQTLAGILLTIAAANYDVVFVVACLLSFLPLYIVYRWVRTEPVMLDRSIKNASSSYDNCANQPALTVSNPSRFKAERAPVPLLSFALLGFLISGTANMLKGIFPILATEYAGLNTAQTGMIYTASTVIILISGPLFGWLADHVSGKLVLAIRGVANTVSSFFYLVSPGLAGIVAGKLIDDAGKAAFRPAWGLMMSRTADADPSRRAQMMGIMGMGEDGGAVAGPILAGVLMTAWGIPLLFIIRIFLAVATEIYAVLLFRRSEKADLHDRRLKQAQIKELMMAARLAVTEGKYEEVENCLEMVVALDRDNHQARQWLATYSLTQPSEKRYLGKVGLRIEEN